MVKVFLTVDTEIWPDSQGWPHTPLAVDHDSSRELNFYFHGGDGPDARGLPYQLRILAAHGLKATYFVDPLFSYALGILPLRNVVEGLLEGGQELGLHLHPEWLNDPRCVGLPAFSGPLLHTYDPGDQQALVRAGLARLAEAGAVPVTAFRAGSWGASRATIAALARNGIRFDSSLNARFSASFPDLDVRSRESLTQPFLLEGVWEFPVTNFVDRPPSGWRPLHVCATSFDEMRMVLEHARDNGWYSVMFVLHSFEFVRVDRIAAGGAAAPQRLLANRFERLCRHLAENTDQYQTCHFADIDESEIPHTAPPSAPVSSRVRTTLRHFQQLASRVY